MLGTPYASRVMRTPALGVSSAPGWPSIEFLYSKSTNGEIWSVRCGSQAELSSRHGAETNPLWPGGMMLSARFTPAAAVGAASRQQAAVASPHLIGRVA